MSRERVLRAAIDFADSNGIDSLSMRKLARELGVEAMTLYYYVANKQDLLDGMADIVAAEIELPAENLDWRSAIRSRATSAHAVLVRHRLGDPVVDARHDRSLPDALHERCPRRLPPRRPDPGEHGACLPRRREPCRRLRTQEVSFPLGPMTSRTLPGLP
jgi:AcrR family transcriptional regulator